jgi:hypothetical protein
VTARRFPPPWNVEDVGGFPLCKAWLSHRNIQHTVRYTELAPDRWFKDFWHG